MQIWLLEMLPTVYHSGSLKMRAVSTGIGDEEVPGAGIQPPPRQRDSLSLLMSQDVEEAMVRLVNLCLELHGTGEFSDSYLYVFFSADLDLEDISRLPYPKAFPIIVRIIVTKHY